ncbi:MAG: SDR family oxidoreductase [Deltaproteobacteria bacterium]|nr:SDR family oxidoreductase [Deltaproteobacteria bacterium]
MKWDIRDKICVITGATTGIGRATAEALAARGAQVILLVRNREKGEAVQKAIQAKTGKSDVGLVVADLGAQREVRRAAAEILAGWPRLDVLINNAGAFNTERTETADGIETTFAVNHLAYFLLTEILLERLEACAPSRIINVASDAHSRGRMRFEDLEGKQAFSGPASYCQSKLANVLFTRELARRLEGTGVTANCLHPGVIASGFALNASGPWNWFFRWARPFLLTSEQGAATTIHLACAPELSNVSGKYFEKSRERRPAARAANDADARRLWEISEAMTRRDPGLPAASRRD